jgi:hypothetical protein
VGGVLFSLKKTSRRIRRFHRCRSGGFRELAFGPQPIVEIMTMLLSASEKQLVRAERDRLCDRIAARQGIATTS